MKKNNNILMNFVLYKNKKSILEKQNIKKDYKNWINKSLNTRIYIKNSLLEYIP